jgi:hypothetical protein
VIEAAEETSDPTEDWRRAVATQREAAKWVMAAFAGVGAAVLGVLPIAGVGEIDTFWTAALAVLGSLVAVAGVALGVWATSTVLAPRATTLPVVAAMPTVVSMIEQDPSTHLGGVATTLDGFIEDLGGWQRTTRELDGARGPDEAAEQRRLEALVVARANLASRAAVGRQLIAFGRFQAASQTFRAARVIMFAGWAAVAFGVGLFLTATVIGGAEETSSTAAIDAGRPVSVRLALSEQGRNELGDRLSKPCLQQTFVRAFLLDGDWVVVASPRNCDSIAFRWDSSFGTISL